VTDQKKGSFEGKKKKGGGNFAEGSRAIRVLRRRWAKEISFKKGYEKRCNKRVWTARGRRKQRTARQEHGARIDPSLHFRILGGGKRSGDTWCPTHDVKRGGAGDRD